MSAIKRFHLFLLHGEANKQHFYKPFIQFLQTEKQPDKQTNKQTNKQR